MRGGRGAKRKGSGFEREVVVTLQNNGIAAERTPLSGAVKTPRFDHDISVPVRGKDWPAEAKRRARQFKTIDGMLGHNRLLFMRDDNSRTMVVMSIGTFIELAR